MCLKSELLKWSEVYFSIRTVASGKDCQTISTLFLKTTGVLMHAKKY